MRQDILNVIVYPAPKHQGEKPKERRRKIYHHHYRRCPRRRHYLYKTDWTEEIF